MNEKKIYAGLIALASSVFGGSGLLVSSNVAELNDNLHKLNESVIKLYEIQRGQNEDIKRIETEVKDLNNFRLRAIESGIFLKDD